MEEEASLSSILLRYFGHGFLFAVLYLVLLFVWAVALLFLVVAGFLIGLLLGLVLLFFIVGGLNTLLTEEIWDIPVRSGWQSILGHGFLLFIVLLIASVPNIIINALVPGPVTTIVFFVIYCFVNGFIAKEVGSWFEEEEEYAE